MNNKTSVRKLFLLIAPYRIHLILSIITAFVSVVFTLYLPILTGNALDNIIAVGNVDFTSVGAILAKMAVVVIVTAFTQWIMNVANNKLAYSIIRDIRERAIDKIEKLPLGYLDRHPSGEIVSRVIADVDQLADGLLMGFTQFFTGVVTIIGTLLFMLSVNVWITCVVVFITPLSFVVASFIARRTYAMFKLQSETRGEQTALIDEMISGQRIVTAFGREEIVQEQFEEINDRLADCSLKATFFSSLTNPCTRFVNNLVYAGVGIVGAVLSMRGIISVGQLSAFLSYANQYTKPFNEISGVVTELQNALACAGRIFELIEENEEAPDGSETLETDSIKGNVDIVGVSFSYNRETELLKDLNLRVMPGQRIAIVGPTGSGKTTLINLIMRFYDVDNGSISVEGKDIRDITRKSLRSAYGMVLQETWLKKGSIIDNIRFGMPNASYEEVVEAAKASHAHSFIKRLPQGYDTQIGDDGEGLSQGQKQLLCIARVMLALPPMLILDEATSSIDTRTEVNIQRAFRTMMDGRTSFIVAHRLSTIREADVILVMKDGNIIEQGNHEMLLKQGGFYSELYNSQF